MDAELAIHEGAGTPRRLLMYVIAVVFCQQQLREFIYGKRFFKVKALQFIAGMQSQIFRLFLGCQQTQRNEREWNLRFRCSAQSAMKRASHRYRLSLTVYGIRLAQ
jgi:hypothetical protein